MINKLVSWAMPVGSNYLGVFAIAGSNCRRAGRQSVNKAATCLAAQLYWGLKAIWLKPKQAKCKY